MNIKLLTEQHLEFLSLKGGCTGSSESIHVKMHHCWKSHVAAHIVCNSMSRSGKFCQRGSNFEGFFVVVSFLVHEERDEPNTTKSGPSSARQMVFRWRVYDGPTLNSALVALRFFRRSRLVLVRNPKFL